MDMFANMSLKPAAKLAERAPAQDAYTAPLSLPIEPAIKSSGYTPLVMPTV